jgi:hypothetical protein
VMMEKIHDQKSQRLQTFLCEARREKSTTKPYKKNC